MIEKLLSIPEALINSGNPELAEWLDTSIQEYLYFGERLDKVLRATLQDRYTYLKKKRDQHLCNALEIIKQDIDNQKDDLHWQCCKRLLTEIKCFENTTWTRFKNSKAPPEKLNGYKIEIFFALKTLVTIPETVEGLVSATKSRSLCI